MHPRILELLAEARGAIAAFEEAKKTEAEKFTENPTNYLSWGSPLIGMQYRARIATYILEAKNGVANRLRELRTHELDAQLMHYGGGSSNAFHRAVEFDKAQARCGLLQSGWLSEIFVAYYERMEAADVPPASGPRAVLAEGLDAETAEQMEPAGSDIKNTNGHGVLPKEENKP